MHMIKCGGIPLPDIVVVGTNEDVKVVQETGLPYIVSDLADDVLAKLLLLRTLKKMFPDILWDKVFNLDQYQMDYPYDGYCRDGGVYYECDDGEYKPASLLNAVNDDIQVNVEELEALGFLPKFMGDIVDIITINYYNQNWTDGYNKKLGMCVGNYTGGREKPNLLIIDVSCSIPLGIRNTMIALVNTLATRCNAEVIITGASSYYWESGQPIDEDWVNTHIHRCNESIMFNEIIKKHILGRDWGYIISFGDGDSPWLEESTTNMLDGNTSVECILHYHTRRKESTGYAEWLDNYAQRTEVNTTWCDDINQDERWC